MMMVQLFLATILMVAGCLAAQLPFNAYLPPPRDYELEDARLAFVLSEAQQPFGRNAPDFVDYPGIHQAQLLRQQQEYALDLPFEGELQQQQHQNAADAAW
ncbi:uncharacterized protein LOC117580886 [Drosophila guanche]|uniref:Uncharacterized protein n=1 Tax=Drosophila guanche TaxID=7266 RepID=A0A3B0JCN5_DROGU|nr:uncharacterized protein LOC117580886 [Drosophila guanche]SPP78343.1 Hypothetical predicted protein [Drosophila guanche]